MKNLIKNILRESEFDWHIDTPSYRFFDVYTCGDTQYDEENGEDECLDGGSYFLKIPEEGIEEFWNYEAEDEYMAGPGDEGRGIIDWAINNEEIYPNEATEYVRELSKKEFCMAVGQNKKHSDVCGENNEIGKGVWTESIENDFDLEDDTHPITTLLNYVLEGTDYSARFYPYKYMTNGVRIGHKGNLLLNIMMNRHGFSDNSSESVVIKRIIEYIEEALEDYLRYGDLGDIKREMEVLKIFRNFYSEHRNDLTESIEDSDWDFMLDVPNSFDPLTQIVFDPPLNLRVEGELLKKLLADLSDSNYWKWNGGGSLLDYEWISRRVFVYSINLGAMGDVTRTTGGYYPKQGYKQIDGRGIYS